MVTYGLNRVFPLCFICVLFIVYMCLFLRNQKETVEERDAKLGNSSSEYEDLLHYSTFCVVYNLLQRLQIAFDYSEH